MSISRLATSYGPAFLGVSLAGVVSGKAVFGVLLVLGIFSIFFSGTFSKCILKGVKKFRTPLGIAVVVLMSAWMLSLFFSILPWESGQVYIRMAVFILLSLLVYQFFLEDERRRDLFLRSVIGALIFVLPLALIGAVFVPEVFGLLKAAHFETVSSVRLQLRMFGSLAGLLFPFVIWAGYTLGGRWRYAGGIVAIFLFLIIFLSRSQSAMAGILAMGFISLVCVIFSRWRMKRHAIILISALILSSGLAALYIAIPYANTVAENSKNPELFMSPWLVDPHRQIIWRHIVELGLEKPWLGWGINTINYVDLAERQASTLKGLTPYTTHPHNWVLEVFSETGIIGLSSMLAVVFMLFWFPLRSFIRTNSLTLVVMLAVSAGYWASSLFSFSFWSAWWQVSYLLLLVILASSMRGEGALMGKPRSSG